MAYTDIKIETRKPHPEQRKFLESKAKRKVIRAGRRGGKTVGMGIGAADAFLDGKRVLYITPTALQLQQFWNEINYTFDPLVKKKVLHRNQTEHSIKWADGYRTKDNRDAGILAKTGWIPDNIRGDKADLIIFDEYQLQNEDVWDSVGSPMLMDTGGDAIFIYTPPSPLPGGGVSKSRDPLHAPKLFKNAMRDEDGWEAWETFHFTSLDNPHLSKEGLEMASKDMSAAAYKKEILAIDEDAYGAWFVYGSFNPEICKIPRRELSKEWPRWFGHDFGMANPAALQIAQDPATGIFIVEEEYFPGTKSPNEHVKAWQAMTEGMLVMARVGGNEHTEEETREAYRMHGWWIEAPKIHNPGAQIDRVRALFELNKIFIFEDNVKLLHEINNCLWEVDDTGMVLDKIRRKSEYHLLDCLKSIATFWRPETVRHNHGIVTMANFNPYAR